MVDPVRRARYAVGATFAVNGMTFANLVPRYPEIVADLGLDNAAFGAAVAAWPLGALLSGLLRGGRRHPLDVETRDRRRLAGDVRAHRRRWGGRRAGSRWRPCSCASGWSTP